MSSTITSCLFKGFVFVIPYTIRRFFLSARKKLYFVTRGSSYFILRYITPFISLYLDRKLYFVKKRGSSIQLKSHVKSVACKKNTISENNWLPLLLCAIDLSYIKKTRSQQSLFVLKPGFQNRSGSHVNLAECKNIKGVPLMLIGLPYEQRY